MSTSTKRLSLVQIKVKLDGLQSIIERSETGRSEFIESEIRIVDEFLNPYAHLDSLTGEIEEDHVLLSEYLNNAASEIGSALNLYNLRGSDLAQFEGFEMVFNLMPIDEKIGKAKEAIEMAIKDPHYLQIEQEMAKRYSD